MTRIRQRAACMMPGLQAALRRVPLVVALGVFSVLGTWNPLEGSGSAWAQTAQAGRPAEMIKVAIPTKNLGFLPMSLGAAKGLYREEGMDLKIMVMKSNIALNALQSAEIEFTGSMGSALRAAVTGLPFKVIFAFNNKPTMYLVAQPQIKSVKELKGKVVGASSVGSTTWMGGVAVLKQQGLEPGRDVTIIGAGSNPEMFAALKAGSLHAAVLTVPFDVFAKRAGFNEVAYVGDVLTDLPMDGLATTEQRIREQTQQVKRFLRASVKGLSYVRQQREEVIAFISKEFGVDRETAAPAYEKALRSYTTDGLATDAGMEFNIRLAKDTLKHKGEVPLARVADFAPLRELLREGKAR